MGLPLQRVKQIEGVFGKPTFAQLRVLCLFKQGTRQMAQTVQSVHLNGGTLAALTQAEPAVSCSSGEIFYGHVYQYQHIIIERPA